MKATCLIPAAIIGSFCGLSLLGSAVPARAASLVDVELAFIIDGSDSISNDDFSQILVAHSNLFTDSSFYDRFIKPLNYDGDGTGKIAVSFFQFGSKVKQEIGWTLIDSQSAATVFGQKILGISKTIWGGSSQIGDAITAATFGKNYTTPDYNLPIFFDGGLPTGILDNEFDGSYKILDIATDGLEYRGYSSELAAYYAAFAGIDAINSIATGTYDPWGVELNLPRIREAQEWAVLDGAPSKGNPGNIAPFVSVAGGTNRYSQFLSQKVALETLGKPPADPPLPPPAPQGEPTSVPEPSTLGGLFGLGAIAAIRRFFTKASL